MENVSKFVVQSVIVGLCALVVSISLFVYKTGSFSLNEMVTRFSLALNSSSEPGFSQYSGRYVDGKTVRSVMEEFGGNYFIRVRTKKDSLSFCVYEKPYKHLVNDGSGSYHDYTKSDSLFYVDENALYFATIYRNDGKTVIGVLFEEQGSGSISGTVAQLYHAASLVEAKKAYLQTVQDSAAGMDAQKIDSAIEYAGNAIHEIEDEIEKLLKDDNSPGETVQETAKRYSEKRDALDAAAKSMADAWAAYQAAYKESTGLDSLGHYDITSDNSSMEMNDLQYWIAKFSGSDNPEEDSAGDDGPESG